MSKSYKGIFRCGSKEHMEQLVGGRVCVSRLVDYRSCSKKKEAQDETEGFLVHQKGLGETTITVNGVSLDQRDVLDLKIDLDSTLSHGCLCFHKITETNFNADTGTFNPYSERLGEWCVVILDRRSFEDRLSSKGVPLLKGSISYTERGSSSKQPENLFTKPKSFEEEEEYRYIFEGIFKNDSLKERVFLDVGDLSDITFMCKTVELHKYMSVTQSK